MTVKSSALVTDDASALRAEVADRIAMEVRHGQSHGETRMTKVTSLLHAFQTPSSPTRINEVLGDLNDHGVAYHSGWPHHSQEPDIRRKGVLTLSVKEPDRQATLGSDDDETIRLSIWSPTGIVHERSLRAHPEGHSAHEVLWFDVDPPVSRVRGEPTPDELEHRVGHITRKLGGRCEGLDEEMLRDLLRLDVQPKVDTYGDDKDGVRGVSALAVIARELPGDEGDSDGVAEELVFQMVEIIVGNDWIVTCWHPSRILSGTTEPAFGDPLLREPFMSHVRHRWMDNPDVQEAAKRQKTPGDLGLYLARSLVDTYGASHRMMEAWVSDWELSFYKSLSDKNKAEKLKEAAGEISNLLSMVGECRRRLTAFEHARWATTDRSWFPNVSDRDETILEETDKSEQVTALAVAIDSAEKSFALLSDNIRADINLLMLQNTATQQESTERLQGYLGKVTGLVLVPTLVVGLFGANTQLPGGGTWLGFEIMLFLMILATLVAFLTIRKLGH